MEQVRQACRLRHFSHRTEDAYCHWIRRFIVFHHTRHPRQLGAPDIERFLSSLATDRHVSASTQNQALCALLFLYRAVIQVTLPPLANVARVRTPPRLPAVLNRSEVRAVLNQLSGVPWLVASLLYGAGLRLLECLELRRKDIDFERFQIIVRQGKGRKDRITMLPGSVTPQLVKHLEAVRAVLLPDALDSKYPNAARSWPWQFAFPASRICRDPQWGRPTRFHLHESVIQRAVAAAVLASGISKRAGCHTFRHHADCRIMPMSATS